MFDPDHPDPDYQLRWPRDLFGRELEAVTKRHPADLGSALSLLFEEAFAGQQPVDDVRRAAVHASWDEGPLTPVVNVGAALSKDSIQRYVSELAQCVENLPSYRQPAYWASRRSAPRLDGDPELRLQNGWSRLMTDLVNHGYLHRTVGNECHGDVDGEEREDRIRQEILRRADVEPSMWQSGTLTAAANQDDFYTVVEVVHDLVARPRTTSIHRTHKHHHFYDFSTPVGQAVYRWRVNQLLAEHAVELELAESGEDTGHLVQTPVDSRRDLLERVRENTSDGNVDRLDHAIAQFRRRDASMEDKRTACTNLAHILENRERLIRRKLNKKDENDLFNIANNFALRHHDAKQRTDYAEEYLDWIFWWYLATVELTNQLLARDDPADG